MGPKTARLVVVLEEIVALLDSDGEQHWRKWMESARLYLLDSDYYGIECVLNAYGGMGSFNDLVIGQTTADGRVCWKDGAHKANNRLDALRSEAYRIADYIRRNHETGNA